MSFSERVKAARTFANLTQEQLAEKAGMRQPSVWYLENGKGAGQRSKYTAVIARACGVNALWLAEGPRRIGHLPSAAVFRQIIPTRRATKHPRP